jgi:hypothetical protein
MNTSDSGLDISKNCCDIHFSVEHGRKHRLLPKLPVVWLDDRFKFE